MVHSIRSRAAGRGTLIFPLAILMCAHPLAVYADGPAQSQGLAAAVRQVEALQRLIGQTAATASTEPGQRYYFDYARLQADLNRIHAGLHDYLAPSRAQPRDPVEINGRYSVESPSDLEALKESR